MISGCVIWITGLSGAGKSSVAHSLSDRINKFYDQLPVMIDGDVMRYVLSDKLGYSIEDRIYLAGVYGRLCQQLCLQGNIVICSTISLFNDVHRWNRENIQNYVEVYLRVPQEELIRRDRKGIYTQDRDIVGVSQDAEVPLNPDIIIENHGKTSIDIAVDVIMNFLKKESYIA